MTLLLAREIGHHQITGDDTLIEGGG